MSYSTMQTADFIPMNLRLGTSATINLDNYNKITASLDLNKLLVPTPPIYSSTTPIVLSKVKIRMSQYQLQSSSHFLIAPGGFKEEFHEITYSFGIEYWYNNQFALRCGYFMKIRQKVTGNTSLQGQVSD